MNINVQLLNKASYFKLRITFWSCAEYNNPLEYNLKEYFHPRNTLLSFRPQERMLNLKEGLYNEVDVLWYVYTVFLAQRVLSFFRLGSEGYFFSSSDM